MPHRRAHGRGRSTATRSGGDGAGHPLARTAGGPRLSRTAVAGLVMAGALAAGAPGALAAPTALVAPVTAAGSTTPAGPATPPVPALAVAPGQSEPEERVREIEYRSRELTFRYRALDNSERVEEQPEETSVTLAADVLFEFDRADLTQAANARLDELADQLADLGPRQVTIDGHTDNRGDPPYNQDLSERRAESVRAALDERLDDEFTFEVAGHGETEPVAPNEHQDGSDNPEGRALNRRVEITFPT